MRSFSRLCSVILAAIITSATCVYAAGADCDPNAILRQNINQYNENISVWLAYLKNLQQTTNSNNSSSVGVSYDGFGLDFADANSLAQYVSDNESYSYTFQDSISVLRSTLDSRSVDAYIACLRSNNPVTVYTPDSVTTDISFPITVHWNPDYPAPNNQTLTVTAINGTVDGKSSTTHVMKNKSDEASFTITRTSNGRSKLYITASIFGKVSDPITLPAIPQFKMTLVPKFSPPHDKPSLSICRSGGCGTTYVKQTACILPDSGSIILPSTIKFVADKLIGDPRRSGSSVEPGGDQFHVCGSIFSSAGGNQDYNLIAGWFLAAQAVLAPIDPQAPRVAAQQTMRASRLEAMDEIVKDASVGDK
jgi:hypothetical protein